MNELVIFGTKMTLPVVLSIWGATLSTLLAFIRVRDFVNNRFKVNITYLLRTDAGDGNDINVQNLSGKPVLLEYMEIFSTKRTGLFKKETKQLWSPEDAYLNLRIDSCSSEKFCFRDADYFYWPNRNIFIRLYFAGKNRPLVKKVG